MDKSPQEEEEDFTCFCQPTLADRKDVSSAVNHIHVHDGVVVMHASCFV